MRIAPPSFALVEGVSPLSLLRDPGIRKDPDPPPSFRLETSALLDAVVYAGEWAPLILTERMESPLRILLSLALLASSLSLFTLEFMLCCNFDELLLSEVDRSERDKKLFDF